MPTFLITVEIVGTVTFVVEAPDGAEAFAAVGGNIFDTSPRGREALQATMVTTKRSVVDTRTMHDDSQISTYTCSFCGRQALKEDWGAGRMRCPSCDRVPRSAAEQQERVARGWAP